MWVCLCARMEYVYAHIVNGHMNNYNMHAYSIDIDIYIYMWYISPPSRSTYVQTSVLPYEDEEIGG